MSWEIFLLLSLEDIITILPLVLGTVLEDIANALRQEKEIRGITTGNKKNKSIIWRQYDYLHIKSKEYR